MLPLSAVDRRPQAVRSNRNLGSNPGDLGSNQGARSSGDARSGRGNRRGSHHLGSGGGNFRGGYTIWHWAQTTEFTLASDGLARLVVLQTVVNPHTAAIDRV